MCTTCGCGGGEAVVIGGLMAPSLDHDHAADHDHDHDHAVDHDHDHDHDHVAGHEHIHEHIHEPTHEPTHAARLVRVERDLLAYNATIATENREAFRRERLLALNLMSSPGAGKTTLLVATLRRLQGTPVGVIEGDQATSLDADRIRAAGAPAVQVNTGAGCHLDAGMISRARRQLPALEGGVLFIENVGNLVCPAAFDLGEARRVVIVSVTEGEDKPLKYPAMFASADLVLITKADLLPHIDFDLAQLVLNIDRVSPRAGHLLVSARTGEGLDRWCAWILAR